MRLHQIRDNHRALQKGMMEKKEMDIGEEAEILEEQEMIDDLQDSPDEPMLPVGNETAGFVSGDEAAVEEMEEEDEEISADAEEEKEDKDKESVDDYEEEAVATSFDEPMMTGANATEVASSADDSDKKEEESIEEEVDYEEEESGKVDKKDKKDKDDSEDSWSMSGNYIFVEDSHDSGDELLEADMSVSRKSKKARSHGMMSRHRQGRIRGLRL